MRRPRLFARRSRVRLRRTPCQWNRAAWSSLLEPATVRNLRRGERECAQPWRRRQSVGVSPVNFRNAAANAVCEA
jgi:hypothetical protein